MIFVPVAKYFQLIGGSEVRAVCCNKCESGDVEHSGNSSDDYRWTTAYYDLPDQQTGRVSDTALLFEGLPQSKVSVLRHYEEILN